MSKIDSNTIEEYQKLLEADPKSKAFAALGEAYRSRGMLNQAETLLRRGISFNPKYAPGYVALGRVALDKKNFDHAISLLKQAIEIAPDNLLAHQCLGETYLQMKNPAEALKAHKMALFLNPQSTRSQQVVKKLEVLCAEEFDDDIFEMKPITNTVSSASQQTHQQNTQQVLSHAPSSTKSMISEISLSATQNSSQMDLSLERGLSFVDALIVRHQMPLAKQKLIELQNRYPGNTEIQARWELVAEESQELEPSEPITPMASREKQIIEAKIQKLQKILATIQKAESHSGMFSP